MFIQDIEKEVRKQVDDAIAEAKVLPAALAIGYSIQLKFQNSICLLIMGFSSHNFQESPMPDPPELFTNVYVKGFGVEVSRNTCIVI